MVIGIERIRLGERQPLEPHKRSLEVHSEPSSVRDVDRQQFANPLPRRRVEVLPV
jgi:hypothetical protein